MWSGEINTTMDNRQVIVATERLFIHESWYKKLGFGEESFEF